MKLIINIFIVCLFLSFIDKAYSQDLESNSEKKYYAIFKTGVNLSNPMGNNFASDAFKSSLGLDIEFSFNLFGEGFILGAHYGFTSFNNNNPEAVGNYDNTNLSYIGPLIGYNSNFNEQWGYLITVGAGPVTYKNTINSNHFRDKGTTIWLSPEINYKLNKTFKIYFSPTIQKDFLNIEAPEEIKSYFKNANYLKVQLGIRIDI